MTLPNSGAVPVVHRITKPSLQLYPSSGYSNVTTDATGIKRITQDYYEQIYSNTLDNLE